MPSPSRWMGLLPLWIACAGCAGLEAHRELRVGENPVDRTRALAAPPSNGLRVTYLGTNGHLLEGGGAAILIDPYFSRIDLGSAAFNAPIRPDEARIARHARHLPPKIDAVLVTHGHFDHLMDVPSVAQRTGAAVYGSPTAMYLAMAGGMLAEKANVVRPGETFEIAGAQVRVFAAAHDRLLFGQVPYPGTIEQRPQAPVRPSHWRLGAPLAFRIDVGGKTVYIDSGGRPGSPPPEDAGPVDLAILGTALPDSRARLGEALAVLRPAHFLPSHQDDFFRPLSEGFVFGPGSDFEAVRAAHRRAAVGRLILMDYFTPWTLP